MSEKWVRPLDRPKRWLLSGLFWAIWDGFWHHDNSGFWACRSCGRETGVGHAKGCPVEALDRAAVELGITLHPNRDSWENR